MAHQIKTHSQAMPPGEAEAIRATGQTVAPGKPASARSENSAEVAS